MGSTRIGPRSAGAILLAALTFLMTGLLWSPARALNTFMVLVDPLSVDCYFVWLKVGQVMKLSLVVEHDSKDLAVHNKVDLSVRIGSPRAAADANNRRAAVQSFQQVDQDLQ